MTGNSGSFSSPFNEADLHAFVDGRLDPVRQIEMTRRLRSHAADRARVEAWREQNELIRATFSEVENEPVPVSLSLLPARLRCIANEARSSGSPEPRDEPLTYAASKRRRSRLLGVTAFTICAALAAAMITLTQPQTRPVRVGAALNPDELLSARANEALARAGTDRARKAALPAITIPNLAAAGFDLIDASTEGLTFAALVLVYQDKNGQRLALGIGKTNGGETTGNATGGGAAKMPGSQKAAPPAITPPAITWDEDGNSFALAGTLDQRHLNEIARLIKER